MIIKNTRHHVWALKRLEEMSEKLSKNEKISVDCLIRYAVCSFLIEQKKKPVKFTRASLEDAKFKCYNTIYSKQK
jgi:hypothetical protein